MSYVYSIFNPLDLFTQYSSYITIQPVLTFYFKYSFNIPKCEYLTRESSNTIVCDAKCQYLDNNNIIIDCFPNFELNYKQILGDKINQITNLNLFDYQTKLLITNNSINYIKETNKDISRDIVIVANSPNKELVVEYLDISPNSFDLSNFVNTLTHNSQNLNNTFTCPNNCNICSDAKKCTQCFKLFILTSSNNCVISYLELDNLPNDKNIC